MKMINLRILLLASIVIFSHPTYSRALDQVVVADATTEKEIHQVFTNWLKAVSSGKPELVEKLYAQDAVLLPTLSPKVHNTPELRKEYFSHFATKPNLKGKINEEHIRVYGDIAVNSGLYTFSFTKDGATVEVPARYSFVYHKTPKGWMIIDHHSSKLPDAN